MRRRTWLGAGAVALVIGLVCATGAQAKAGRLVAHGSVQQIYATGLAPRARVSVLDRRGTAVATRRADELGGIVFRKLAAGRGYRLRAGARTSTAVTVLPDHSAPPTTRAYAQKLPAGGYGYLRTRDGTSLAIDVRLPGAASGGPYPTLVEYAGYGYADPAGAESGISAVANLLGFAVVDVNIRGTGCSGGSFDYFEPLQGLDGYDVIETVARQPWVLGHRAGMLGISYGGISQLFVGATDPPHLAAITPLSVIDNTATTLYPGGLLNTGFALGWARDRAHDALPASRTGGQPWAFQRIRHGDRTCRANQVLHGEAPNVIAMVRANNYFVPSVANPLAPITFVKKIHAPVYLACQFTDEQTGGHCADLAQHFTGTSRKWFTFTNGAHIDSLDPQTFNRWYDFMQLYVAHRRPQLSDTTEALAPTVFAAAMGIDNVTLPPDPIRAQPTYAAALAAFQALKAVRIMFDNGAGSSTPGAPYPGFEQSFSRFPVPRTQARSWYLGGNGTLSGGRPTSASSDEFTWKPRARAARSFSGADDGSPGGLWRTTPGYHWQVNPAGTAAAYLSAPLRANAVVIGAGAVQLWIQSSAPSVDLQATISEVRPDGKETFVQDGWLRASERKLDAAQSTPLAPALSLRRADVLPLPRGRYTKVTVPLYYEGHAYRQGSRIRVTISAPGGDQPVWAFSELNPHGSAKVLIAHSPAFPSRVVLPVVAGVGVPTGLPPCPGLRGEPCRVYQAYRNHPVALG